MDRNRIIIITIILCLLFGNVAYALLLGGREPFLYSMNNKMNYNQHEEEKDIAHNDPVKMEEEIDLSTEMTTEQNTERNKRKEKSTEQKSTDRKEEKKGSEKKSDKKSDKKTTEEDKDGENEDGGNDDAVNSKKLVELICTWKNNDNLLYGKPLNSADIHVTGKYDNGDEENIPIENCTIDGFNSKKLGAGSCMISYYGLSKKMSYTILNYELSIFCESWDKRYQYRYGDTFTNSDITVYANMADGSKEKVSSFKVSGMQMNVVGDHVCQITYKSFTINEDYSIKNYPVSLASSIRKFTVRGDVSWSELTSGQTFTAAMADGTSKELSAADYHVSGYSTDTAGSMVLTISFDGVSMTIPYVVYYDSLRVIIVNDTDRSEDIHFTKELLVSSADSLGIQKVYNDAESGDEYTLEGIYLDSEYKHELEYPKTYTANKKFRINSDGLPWHEYTLYAKYSKK